MNRDRLLVIDEGTTSTRAILFGRDGKAADSRQEPIGQHYPRPGWVEHDAEEIWRKSLACARQLVGEAEKDRIAGIGITNQRETIVFWSRRTGRPLAPAIVWQDRRTAEMCERLRVEGHEEGIQRRTGLLLDPYFSGTKIAWALDQWPQLREAGADLAIGTVDSWLIFQLTGGLHVTDATNASRTLLMDLESGAWSEEYCDLFQVPRAALPEIVDCAGPIGETTADLLGTSLPISGVAGDQQAAAIGQACLRPGETKATYGTGAFILSNAGDARPHSSHRLLSTLAWQLGGVRSYALEGSIFVAGSLVQWLRDGLGLIETSSETATFAASVEDSGGVYLVPALSGLGAPHWRPDATAALTGLTFAANRAHIVRAALEAMAYQTHDLMRAFSADGADWSRLRIDGGMAANDWMAQDLADILGLEVERPDLVETTALGAAMLAGVGCGWFGHLDEAAAMRGQVDHFRPEIDAASRRSRLEGWQNAIGRVLSDGRPG